MASWLPVPPDSHFSLANIPFGIISTDADATPRPAIAIGDHVLDLRAFASGGGFASAAAQVREHADAVFSAPTLNAFAALGRPVHRAVRAHLQAVLSADTPLAALLRDNKALRRAALVARSAVCNHLPLAIGDYTDFYAGKNHAYNVGVLLRGPDNALQANYMHLPVAYHGRASSVVSGTPIRRPWGQIVSDAKAEPKVPVLAPCEKLDLELEMGMFLCRENAMGSPVPVDEADDYVFGYVLLNDWSARDLQAWEYAPLGPFTAKNLGTSISQWVVLADALQEAKGPGIPNDTPLLPYLAEKTRDNVLSVELEVDLITNQGDKTTISRTNSRNLMWSWPQMIAHHTISGCNLRLGDLLGSGTISGLEAMSQGSIMEQTQGGKVALKLQGGEERRFLHDGDTLVIRGWAGKEGALVGFGDVSGTILPALPLFKTS